MQSGGCFSQSLKVSLAIFFHPGNTAEEAVRCSSLRHFDINIGCESFTSVSSGGGVKSKALFQPASVEVQPARSLSDSRQQIHLPSGASFTLHYPKSKKTPLLSDFYTDLLHKVTCAAGFSLNCASASVPCPSAAPVSHVLG